MNHSIISGGTGGGASSLRGLFGSIRILWQNISGSYVAGLHESCPIQAVTCVDDGSDFDILARYSGIQFCSLEKRSGRRACLEEPVVEDIIPVLKDPIEQILRRYPRESWVIVCPRPCRSLAAFAAEAGYRAVLHPVELGFWLFDKANFFGGLDQLRLPRLNGRWIRLSGRRYSELASEFGAAFVAQLPEGAGGNGTLFIRSEADFTAAGARFGDALMWVAPFLSDVSVNINAVAAAGDAAVGYPSIQLAGLADLGAGPGAYCGNDFAATRLLPAETVEEIQRQTARIGEWLSALGYRGLYGLDFVLDQDNGRAYAVDLNPRWQGSTFLSTQAELEAGRLPLAVAELAYRFGALSETELLGYEDDFSRPIVCSQMVLHAKAAEWTAVTGEVLPGVYREASDLAFLRQGIVLGNLDEQGEFLVTSAVARQGTLVGSSASLARVFGRKAALDSSFSRLVPWGRAAAAALYRGFDLQPVS